MASGCSESSLSGSPFETEHSNSVEASSSELPRMTKPDLPEWVMELREHFEFLKTFKKSSKEKGIERTREFYTLRCGLCPTKEKHRELSGNSSYAFTRHLEVIN